MTTAEALDVSKRSVSFRDAEVFLQTALGRERAWLHAHPEAELSTTEAEAFEHMLQKREANQPVAYIVGQKEFYGRPFKTDERALIPRPESEGLIDLAKAYLEPGMSALELGTGSGNLAVTLALETGLPVLATDVAPEVLELATENARGLGAEVQFIQADLFEHPDIAGPYDLIIANLPYVPSTWKQDPTAQPEVVFAEPDIALFGGIDGLDLYRRFFAEAPRFLKPDGLILAEFNEDQGEAISKLAQAAFPQKKVVIHQDYAGLDRILHTS